jgi:hypothetical protein
MFNILKRTSLNIKSTVRSINKFHLRTFGSTSEHDSKEIDHHSTHHDSHDHGDHGHHEITGEVDTSKIYFPLNQSVTTS